ncbi:MAG: c-type cytochrome biogenesis protein CcmI [Halioglobus sp.]|nr:c-type cytochrome biogenesis protein CcmI [Halioglobus sp.]
MTLFLLACAGLLLVSAVFFFLPLSSSQAEQDPGRANLQWYRVREQELGAQEDAALAEDARLRLLEDGNSTLPQAQQSEGRFPRWLLLPLVTVLAGGFYYRLGGMQDVLIAEQLQALGEQTSAEQRDELIDAISRRSSQRPDNLHYISLLARYHMGEADYGAALASYERLLQEVPEDAQTLAYAAQAGYMAAGRVLDDRARLRAEQALAANPHQRTALGLLGMASYEQGQYRAAISYWQRLQVMEQPGSESSRMIADVIAQARRALGEMAPQATGQDVASASRPVAPAAAGPGITVSVSLPDGARVRPQDTVFILARDAASDSRMPVAVQRRSGAELPLTVRLDDSNSMAGRKVSELAALRVSVQVSPDGRPGEANASWVADSDPVAPGAEVALVLQAR